MPLKDDINRREFLAPAAAGLALTIVPSHVLGGPGYVAPSDKITLAYIGCGTQGTREMLRLHRHARRADHGRLRSRQGRHELRRLGQDRHPRQRAPQPWKIPTGAPASPASAPAATWPRRSSRPTTRRSGQRRISRASPATPISGSCSKRRRTSTAVKIMTPDHLHATISIAAMKKRKHVLMHKPLSNRVAEVRMVVESARKTGVATHLLAWRAAAHRRPADDPGRRHRQPEGSAQLDRPALLAAAARAAHRPAARSRRTSIGTCGWGPSAIVPIIPAIPTPSSAAGTTSAAAASPTWATTACGRSSWRSTCPSRTASKLNPAPVPRSTTRSAPSR